MGLDLGFWDFLFGEETVLVPFFVFFFFFCFLFGQNNVILHLPSLHFIFIETMSLILCRFGAYLAKKKKKKVQQDDMAGNSRN